MIGGYLITGDTTPLPIGNDSDTTPQDKVSKTQVQAKLTPVR